MTDALYIPVTSGKLPLTRRKSNSFIITITDLHPHSGEQSAATFIGLKDEYTNTFYTMPITIIPTPLEGTDIEVIK